MTWYVRYDVWRVRYDIWDIINEKLDIWCMRCCMMYEKLYYVLDDIINMRWFMMWDMMFEI